MSITIDGKEYYGIIYKIENKINHKVYIGQTTNKNGFNGRYCRKGKGIEKVYNYHNYRKNRGSDYNPHLLNAIEKYGFDSFEIDEVFDVALSSDELHDKEIFYIKQFDSFYNGYNRTLGGEGMLGYAAPSGKDNKFSMRVCQINPSDNKLIKIWDSLGDIKREFKISGGAIANVCAGRKGTSCGFVWVYEKDYDPNKDYRRVVKKRGGGNFTKPILLLDSDNNILREFMSAIEVSVAFGISKQEVSKICKHQRKNPRYNLIYKNEYIEEQRLNVRGFVA